jgi:hypothetical protein
MVFPTIPTAAAGRVLTATQADTTATRTFPSLTSLTKDSGDLLIAICVAYQTGTGTNAAFSSWGGGFTEFHDSATSTTMAIGAAYKWSTGSETGTFTVTQAGTITGHAVMFLLSIPGAHATTPPEAGGRVSDTTTVVQPGALDPAGWAAEDTLWISLGASGETGTGGAFQGMSTGDITPYTDNVVTGISADVVGGVEAKILFRQANAASEQPPAFSNDISNARGAALTIAVRPSNLQTVAPSAIASGEAFGSPTVDIVGGISTIVPGGVATLEAVGSPAVDTGATAAQYIGVTSVAQTGTAGTSSPSAAMPSGTNGGDLLLAFHAIGSSSDTISFPAGWSTPVRNTGGTGIGDSFSWKIAAGSVGSATTEPALVVTSGSSRNHAIVLLAYRVSDTVNPIVATPSTAITVATTSKATPGGTASGDILELNFITDHPAGSTSTASTWTPPANVTQRGAANNVQNGFLGTSIVVGEFNTNPTSSGSMPSRTWTTSLSCVGSAWSVAIKSGGAPSAPTPTISYRANGLSKVRVKTVNATSVRLKIGTNSAVTTGVQFTSAVTPTAEGLSLHDWSGLGLTAGTRYYYKVMMTDSLSAEAADTEGTVGSFKVPPTGQTSFNFCFGSCTEATDSAALAKVALRGDDFFLQTGDLYYADGTGTDAANFRAKFDAKLSATNHHAVFATAMVSYQPSDHDGGMNNNYVGTNDATARDNFNTVYRERMPNSPVETTTGTYYAFTWGRIRFIHADERSFKSLASATDNSSKTMLGTTQKQWLKDQITNATEPVIIWVGDTAWTGATTASADHWAGYNTERTEMANFITASGKNVARIGGDMHAVAADDGTNSAGGIAVFHGAPLNNNASQKGTPYSHGPIPSSGTTVVQQYGRMVVTDSGGSISLAFTGYDDTDTSLLTYTKTYTLPVTTLPTGIASAEAVGSPSVGLVLNTASTAIASTEAFGSPTVGTGLTVTPTGLASAEVFGTPALASLLTTSPTGVASGNVFGTPILTSLLTLSPTAIASSEAFGATAVTSQLYLTPTSIATANAFGTPTLSVSIPLSPTAIASVEAFGTALVGSGLTLAPSGGVSVEAFGVPIVSGVLIVTPTGIATTNAFGTTTLASTIAVLPTAIASLLTVPNPVISTQLVLTPTGIVTEFAFGSVLVSFPGALAVTRVASSGIWVVAERWHAAGGTWA